MTDKANKPTENDRNSTEADPGWGPMLRMLRLCAALVTIYAFYHGYSSPEHVFGAEDEPTVGLRLLAGTLVAFLPSILFALTFARSWK